MSPRLLTLIALVVIGVAGCGPNPRIHSQLSHYSGDVEPVASSAYGTIDGEVSPAQMDEDAVIRQAMAAHHDQIVETSPNHEEAIIEQAVAAQEAMVHENVAAPVHHARYRSHRSDVVMTEVRKHNRYLLDSGDRVRVFVYGQPNLSRTYSVDDGGFISVPLIGTVRAREITTHELERSIGDLLAAEYVKDPKVSVEIAQYRPFFILGEVRRAGQYPFVNAMTVQSAVAIAGGFSERAHEKSVKLTRIINGYRATVEVAPTEPVYPGDIIHVRERFF